MATIPKKYLHDRLVLLLASISTFLSVFTVLWVLLKLSGGHSGSYIVQYRANLGISAFKTGSVTSLLSFPVFAVLVAALAIVLSFRTYRLRRQLAVAILSLGLLLEVMTLIVANALLVLK